MALDQNPAPGDGGDIIIKGGSCEMEFNASHFPREEDAGLAKHTRDDLKITRIVVTGDVPFDETYEKGFAGKIIISYVK